MPKGEDLKTRVARLRRMIEVQEIKAHGVFEAGDRLAERGFAPGGNTEHAQVGLTLQVEAIGRMSTLRTREKVVRRAEYTK